MGGQPRETDREDSIWNVWMGAKFRIGEAEV
jgi:hypothetical protein